jgi:hypothetical protein
MQQNLRIIPGFLEGLKVAQIEKMKYSAWEQRFSSIPKKTAN